MPKHSKVGLILLALKYNANNCKTQDNCVRKESLLNIKNFDYLAWYHLNDEEF